MRIAHFDVSKIFRGGQRQVLLLHKGLIENGISSYLIADIEGELYQFAIKNNIKNVIGVKQNKRLNSIIKRFLKYRTISKIINENQISHLHFHESSSLIYSLFFNKRMTIFHTRRVSFPIKNSSIKLKYSTAHYHIGVSNSIKEYLEEKGLKNVFHIPSSIDVTRFENVENKHVLKNKKAINLMYIGSFYEMKGVDVLLNAFPDVIKKYQDIHLHLVGNGALLEEHQKLADDNAISDYVTFYGAVPDTQFYYKEADCIIVPSRYGEGSNGIIKEALASKKLVIASNLKENLEIIQHGKNGIVFENENSNDLYNKIIEYLEYKYPISPEFLFESVQKFKVENMVKSYIEVYNQSVL